MSTYSVLNALPPEAFLDANNFTTETDHLPAKGYREEQYKTGIETGRKSKRVGVSAGGTWWADLKDGGWVTSYEGIGYHSCTKELWQGLLDSGAEVWIYRRGGPENGTRIK